MTATAKNAERLVKDLKTILEHAEDFVRDIPDDINNETRRARKRLQSAVDNARGTCRRWEKEALEGIETADEYVHDKPYQFIGGALVVGLLIGVLLKK